MASIYNDEKKLISLINRKRALLFILKIKNKVLKCITKKYTGVKTIGRAKFEKEKVLHIELNVSSGKAKVILIKNKKIKTIAENNFIGDVKIENGKYRLRIVGENSNLNLKINLIK